ncbi:MAG: hypothetical protein JW751_09295, partial [Polyangiaceae bacterium]|nr:hypothetical protein [Polyangiaceae bacterium]
GFGGGEGVSAVVVGRAALQQRLCLGRAPHTTTHTASRCGTRATRVPSCQLRRDPVILGSSLSRDLRGGG